MSETKETGAAVVNPSTLTAEQKKTLQEVFHYQDSADYTAEDLKLAREMFDTPEKFKLLRKILQVLTPSEKGMTIPTSPAFVDATPEEKEKFAYAVAVDLRADEKIRQTLVSFYRLLREDIQSEMKKDFEESNKAEFEEKQRTEEYEEKKEIENREVGENL